LQKEISTHLPGDEVDVTFNRNGEVSKVKVKLGRLDGE
jgi:S1-C subfamily serine protease